MRLDEISRLHIFSPRSTFDLFSSDQGQISAKYVIFQSCLLIAAKMCVADKTLTSVFLVQFWQRKSMVTVSCFKI